jgi:hypothetical protein
MDSAITDRRRMIAIISPLPADETTFTFDYTHPQSPCLQGLGSAVTLRRDHEDRARTGISTSNRRAVEATVS